MARPIRHSKGKGNVDWTRAQLIEAAASQFSLHGYEGASLSKIREIVDVKNSTIHYHFGSKEGLYLAVGEQLLHNLECLADTLETASPEPGMERLCHLVESLQSWVSDNQAFTSIVVQEMMNRVLRSAEAGFYQGIGTVFRRFGNYLRGEDTEHVWRTTDWEVLITQIVFSVMVGQTVAVAVPLAYNRDEADYRQSHIEQLILNQLLALSIEPKKAIRFLQKTRPHIVANY